MDNREKVIKIAQSWNGFQQMMTRFEDRVQKEIINVYLEKKAANKPRRKRVRQMKQIPDGESCHGRLNISHELSTISEVHETDGLKLRERRIPLRSKRTAARKAIEKTSLQLRQTLNEKLRKPGTSSDKFQTLNINSKKEKTTIISLPVTDEIEENRCEGINSKQIALPQCAVMLERCDNLFSLEKGTNNFNDSEADFFKIPTVPLKKCRATFKNNSACQSSSFLSLSKSKDFSVKFQNGGKDIEAQSVLCENNGPASLSVPMDTFVDTISPHVSDSGSNGISDGTNVPPASLNLGTCQNNMLKEQNLKSLLKEQDNSDKSDSIMSTSIRPVRTKNRNKKYNEDEFYFALNPSTKTKVASIDSTNTSKKNNVLESSIPESNNRRRTKRKSEEDLKNNVKHLKLNESKVSSQSNMMEETIGSVNKQTENMCVDIVSPVGSNKLIEEQASKSNSGAHVLEIIESPIHQSPETESLARQPSKTVLSVLLPSTSEIVIKESEKDQTVEAKSSSDRARTRTITNPTVMFPVAVTESHSEKNDVENVETSCKTDTSPLLLEPTKPEQRMTRTRTREINKKQVEQDKIKSDILRMKSAADLKSIGKENNTLEIKILLSNEKALKMTPLSSNILFSPTPSKSVKHNGLKILPSNEKTLKMITPLSGIISPMPQKSQLKSAGISHGKKQGPVPTSTAVEKKLEMLKANVEDNKRKREEKERKILLQKQAIEKEKQEKLAKLIKEKEEKEKAILADRKRAKDEQIRLKKQQTEATLKEAEERKMKMEESKQAYYKKIEEEKRKLAEERQKQAEEAKKLHEKRLAEKAKDQSVTEAVKLKKMKEKQNQYELTPAREDTVPKPLKNENNYGLSDQGSDDSSDDEQHPKKVIPKWAAKATRLAQASIQKKMHSDLVKNFFPLNYSWQVKMNEILTSSGLEKNIHTRRSSAVWDTPTSSNRV